MPKIKLSEIKWGPIDAGRPDENFLEKLCEPESFSRLLADDCSLISGEKGSGKTAVRQALLQKYANRYFAIADISFDQLEFTRIVKDLLALAELTSLEALNLLRNYWRYCLIVEAMRAFVSTQRANAFSEATKIRTWLANGSGGGQGIMDTMLDLLARAWSYAANETAPAKKTRWGTSQLPDNLTARIIDTIRRLPNEEAAFQRMEKLFVKVMEQCEQPILLILDGFDTIRNASKIRHNVNLVFESLCTAAYALTCEKSLSKFVQLKALIPNDRFINMSLRDSDKLNEFHRAIRWDYQSLKLFLLKRMQCHPRLRGVKEFSTAWTSILPEKIINPHYKIEEDTYEYILRHSMYRPRHLQIHLNNLANLYEGRSITSSMVTRSLAQSSKEVASFYLKEYELDHPNLDKLLSSSFKGKENVMPYGVFRGIIADGLKTYRVKYVTVDEKIDVLYSIGFFGIVERLSDRRKVDTLDRYYPPRKTTVGPYKVDFYYSEATQRRNVSHTLSDNSLIALHPVFVDYVDMAPHEELIIG